MSKSFSIAEARHDLAALVHQLDHQPRIELTRRGKPVAVLMSVREYNRLVMPTRRFWDAYAAFAGATDLRCLEIEPEVFPGVGDRSSGRGGELVSAKYLLDTNVVSEPLRPSPNVKVLARMKRHQDELAIASIVWHELWFGCQRLPASAKRDAIERYLNEVVVVSMPILPYDHAAAEWHAAERARLTALGKTPPFVDGQIIAIAYASSLTLVTLNPSDYIAFAGVKIEDWSVK